MRNAPPSGPPQQALREPLGSVTAGAEGLGGTEVAVVSQLPAARERRGRRSRDPSATGRRGLRRAIAYVLMISYALLMFVPFTWTVITSFKTRRRRAAARPHPRSGHARGLAVHDRDARSEHRHPLHEQRDHRRRRDDLEPRPRVARRLRVRAAPVPGSGDPVPRRPGHADDPGPAPAGPAVRPVHRARADPGLRRSTSASILVLAISATSIFLLRQYFLSIPKDLEEAARIDGAGFFTTFRKVMLPAGLAGPCRRGDPAVPGHVELVLLAGDPAARPATTGRSRCALYLFRESGGFTTNWPPLMAVIVIATIPILVLYIFFQRFFVEGVAASGVKG